jgi:predicted flap endonuclease-1-like 5' DNA nuclease
MVEQADAPAVDGDSKMLVVLNQQLSDARESNERLTQLVRTLEAELAQAPAASAPRDDDLTRIRGIGPKVAGQLTEYGINSFAELADIEPDALEDEAHPLNALKGRIIKDAWIDQARQLEARE